MTEKFPCKTPGCKGMILPATADRTGGYCMPCVQKTAREEKQKYIEQHRKDVDPFTGIEDRVEIIKTCHQDRPYDPLIRYLPYHKPIEKVYQELTSAEETRLLEYFIEEVKQDNKDILESIGLELAAFRDADLSVIHDVLLEKQIYYPSMLFKHASDKHVAILIERLDDDTENRNLVLLVLAWACDSKRPDHPVTKVFAEWRISPPGWAGDLFIPPQDYAMEAGWYLDENNERTNLFLPKCYPLIPVTESTEKETVVPCDTLAEHCHWCKRKLTRLFSLDLSLPQFDFIPFRYEQLNIVSCDACASYSENLYMQLDEQGNGHWSDYNRKPGYLPDDADDWDYLPEYPLKMSSVAHTVDYAADWILPTSFSRLGGMPTWIQDSAYPDCPSCQKKMMFVAQLSREDIEEYGEGIYYNFICTDCAITATNYQQT